MIAKPLPTVEWEDDATALIRAIDPDAGPLYLLDMDDVEVTGPSALSASGCTSNLLDIHLRDKLKAAGTWMGRGFVGLVRARSIEDDFRRLGIGHDARRKILAVTLHEYAHHLDCCDGRFAPALASEQRADELIAEDSSLADYLQGPPEIGIDDDALIAEPWRYHDGERFGRACLHLWWRANFHRPDLRLHPNDVWCSYQGYRLSGPAIYAQVLGDEPQARSGEPLRAIMNLPAPEDYVRFCNQDLKRSQARLARDLNYLEGKPKMTANVLDRIVDHEKTMQARADGEYRALVLAAEAGDDIEAADASRILQNAKKTARDLADSIDLIRSRRNWVAQAAKKKEVEAALAELYREKEASQQSLSTARETWRAQQPLLTAREATLLAQHADCLKAIDALERTANDPQIIATEKQLADDLVALAAAERGIRAKLDDHKKYSAVLRSRWNAAKAVAAKWARVPGISAPAQNAEAMAREKSAFDCTAVKPLEAQLQVIETERAKINRAAAGLAELKRLAS